MAESVLFIPDISGFTKFVKTTEINHGKHIIEELINLIIDEAKRDFEVAEIEGDAVFFYSNKSFSPTQIVESSKRIFVAFHKHLLKYEYDRICNCGACSQAIKLTLKFVVHMGEITLANYGSGKAKPYGDAVIEAHRLLKNEIQSDQYILFTDKFLKDSELEFDGKGSNSEESLGNIDYKYLLIDHWKSDVVLDKKELKHDKVDVETRFDDIIPIDTSLLHQYISDFRYRKYWNLGASDIIYDENEINKSGSEHYCIVDSKNLYFDTIKPEYGEGLSYGEILKNPSPLKYFETNFFLSRHSLNETRLKLVLRVSFKWWLQVLLKPMIAYKLRQQAAKVIASIKATVKDHEKELSAEEVYLDELSQEAV